MMNQQENKNSLPKYWIVQCNTHNPNWRKVIDYLKDVHGERWGGDVDGSYYGYDGGLSCWNGTNVYSTILEFRNSPVVLTIEEFVEMTEENVFPKYVKCINLITASMHQKYTGKRPEVGKIYKVVETSYPEKGACVLTHVTECGVTVYTHATKPSTKEAFDKQQQKQEETMRTITHTQAQSIIDIACSTWKDRLFTKWGKNIVMKDSVIIPERDYQDMRNACTSEQNQLFDEIFGSETKFKVGDWVVRTKENHVGMQVGDIDQIEKISYDTITLSKYKGGGHASHDVDYFRLATEEEIQKAKYIPKGTPCLVRDNVHSNWELAYSLGDGTYRGELSIRERKQVQVLDINNLPKY